MAAQPVLSGPEGLTRQEAIEQVLANCPPDVRQHLEKLRFGGLFVELYLGIPGYWPGNRPIEATDFCHAGVRRSWELAQAGFRGLSIEKALRNN